MNHKPQTITPIYYSQHKCKECGGRIWWAFIPVDAHWQEINGRQVWVGYDWHLDVYCFCGEVTDEAIIEDCYNEHRRMVCDEIHRQQNEAFDAFLGLPLHGYFHEAAGGSR